MKKTNRQNAFTMVELVMVLLIVSTIAAVALLNYTSSQSYAHLNHAADQLLADLNIVRSQACKDRQSYELSFNVSTKIYNGDGVASLKGPAAIRVDLSKPPYNITDITLSGFSGNTITFDGRGNPTETGTIKLNINDQSKTITINQGGEIVIS